MFGELKIFDDEMCSCDGSDSLTVRTTLATRQPELGTYCGSKLPPAIMSANQRLDIAFVSTRRPLTSSSTSRGFNASFQFVKSSSVLIALTLQKCFLFSLEGPGWLAKF